MLGDSSHIEKYYNVSQRCVAFFAYFSIQKICYTDVYDLVLECELIAH